MTPQQRATLIAAACEVRRHAHAPYSKFLVGAAILTDDGRTFTGVNVENASYGLTNCAERVAIGTAVAAGAKKLAAVVVATAGGFGPCGACRQVIAEFGDDQLPVVLVDADNPSHMAETTLGELLPGRFSLKAT